MTDASADAGQILSARLGTGPSEVSLRWGMAPLLAGEFELFDSFLRVDLAHVVMLGERGILTKGQTRDILRALVEARDAGAGAFKLDVKAGSFLLQIERYLASKIGEDTAGRMVTGRSRNDQSAAVNRLHVRGMLLEIADALLGLQGTILRIASQHAETHMPGYTHLQHAQPTTYGHYLMRHYHTLERDQQRLAGAYARTDLSALGGAAMIGTTWPIDRQRTAQLLGHEDLVLNATDAGIFTRDYPAENAAVLSILVSNCARLAGDLYLWSTWEFGMVEIDGSLAGTSSIMPQKKNPHALERVRGIGGLALGWLPSILGTLRTVSSSDLDLHFAPDPTFQMGRETIAAIELLRATLDTLTIKPDTMSSRAGVYWTTASNLADSLVRERDLPFRAAHGVVGRLVRNCVEAGIGPEGVTGAMVDRAARETLGRALGLSDETVQAALDYRSFIANLRSLGSAKPSEVRNDIAAETLRQQEHERWSNGKRERIAGADRELATAISRFVG
jgi:argininosuccinate lyase